MGRNRSSKRCEASTYNNLLIPAKGVNGDKLHKDQEYTVKNDQGGVNVFVIRDGKAWVTEASCPDKICMDQGQVSQEGEMIVCLPNRMTARVMGAP